MRIGLLVLLPFFVGGCCIASPRQVNSVYRCSSNRNEAIVYVYGTIAVLRVERPAQDGKSTLPSYSVVRAHWAGDPDTIYSTGDIVDQRLVGNVTDLVYYEEKRIMVGRGTDSSMVPVGLLDLPEPAYFIIREAEVRFFDEEAEMRAALMRKWNITLKPLEPVGVFFEEEAAKCIASEAGSKPR